MSQFDPSAIASISSAENFTFVLAVIITILQIPGILSSISCGFDLQIWISFELACYIDSAVDCS